jgi:hypothetical protein
LTTGGLLDVDAKGNPWRRRRDGVCFKLNKYKRWTKNGETDEWGSLKAPKATDEDLKYWETMMILRRRRRMQWRSRPCRRRNYCGRCGARRRAIGMYEPDWEVDNCEPAWGGHLFRG